MESAIVKVKGNSMTNKDLISDSQIKDNFNWSPLITDLALVNMQLLVQDDVFNKLLE